MLYPNVKYTAYSWLQYIFSVQPKKKQLSSWLVLFFGDTVYYSASIGQGQQFFANIAVISVLWIIMIND